MKDGFGDLIINGGIFVMLLALMGFVVALVVVFIGVQVKYWGA